jgi:biopolymer transport protein TolR
MAGGLMKRGGGRNGRYTPNAEINVTPMVDVMLVLLVIFMVTAPMLTVGVPVDLPQANAPNIPEDRTPVEITVQKDGTIYVQENKVTMDNLMPLLLAVTDSNPETRIYVRGDAGISYGQMMQVMGEITTAGFKKVGLVALPAATASRH